MKKKTLFLIILGLLVVIAGGVFWWRQERETKGSPKDYVVKETSEGIFVENKKAGLKIEVPEGWKVKKVETEEGWIMFYSPETNLEWERDGRILLPLERGCIIDISVIYEEMDLIDIKLDIKYGLATLGLKSLKFDERLIKNRYPALQATFTTEKTGEGVIINVPYNKRVYNFGLSWGSKEKEECLKEFNKFLERIQIK